MARPMAPALCLAQLQLPVMARGGRVPAVRLEAPGILSLQEETKPYISGFGERRGHSLRRRIMVGMRPVLEVRPNNAYPAPRHWQNKLHELKNVSAQLGRLRARSLRSPPYPLRALSRLSGSPAKRWAHKVGVQEAGGDPKRPGRRGSPNHIFQDLRLLGVVAAFLGYFPISFSPMRISFRPDRSSLLWSLLLYGLVVWSAAQVLLRRMEEIEYPYLETPDRLRAVQNILHVSGVLLIPLFWMQANNFHKVQRVSDRLASLFPFRSTPRLRRMSVMIAVLGCVVSPLLILVYLRFQAYTRWWTSPQYLAHFIASTLNVNVPMMFAAAYLAIRSCALQLSQWFAEELRSERLVRGRVQQYREAWLLLQQLLSCGVVLPVAILCFLVYTVALLAIDAYQTIMQFGDDEPYQGAIFAGAVIAAILLMLFMFDSAERAAEAVENCISDFIEDREYVELLDQDTIVEMEQLYDLISSSKLAVSVGGFCSLNRGLLSSVLTTTVTYLVVLLQIPTNDKQNERALLNATNATLTTAIAPME